MVNVLLKHEVKEYASWRVSFDSDEPRRTAAGISIIAVFTSVDNANMVTVMTQFPSIEVVNAFVGDPSMKEALERAGVVGAPEVQILNVM
jgi:hypothetical protein